MDRHQENARYEQSLPVSRAPPALQHAANIYPKKGVHSSTTRYDDQALSGTTPLETYEPRNGAPSNRSGLRASSLPVKEPERTNGVARSGSRRRRDSRGYEYLESDRGINENRSRAAPDYYEDTQPNGGPEAQAHGHANSRSFSARARGATQLQGGRKLPNGQFENPERSRDQVSSQARRRSIVNPGTAVSYPQIQQPATRPSYSSSSTNPSSLPQRSGTTSSRRYSEATSPISRSGLREDPISIDTEAQQEKDWAPDRSPLQNLEVKLNDISKEEKRARVEEAEARAAQGRPRASRNADALVEPSRSKRGHPSGEDRGEQGVARNPTKRQTSTAQPVGTAEPNFPDQSRITEANRFRQKDYHHQGANPPATSQGSREVDSRRGSRRLSTQVNGEPALQSAAPVEGLATHNSDMHDSAGHIVGAAAVGAAIADGIERGNSRKKDRQGIGFQEPLVGNAKSKQVSQRSVEDRNSRQVPQEQQQLYAYRADRSELEPSAIADLGLADPLSRQAVRNRSTKGPNYEIPPQTAAGQNAREQLLEGASITALPAKHHHFKDIFHHEERSAFAERKLGPIPQLEEWRQGKTARLLSADFVLDTESSQRKNTWWEDGASGGRKRSSGPKNSGPQAAGTLDSGFETNNGTAIFHNIEDRDEDYKHQLRVLWRKSRVFPVPRNSIGREDISTKRPRVQRRTDSWPFSHAFVQFARKSVRSSYIPSFSLPRVSSEYSENAPSRQFPKGPTAFTPPLFLKCGPLLRYTGMRRENVSQSGRNGTKNLEREMWRGSVMIVTSDADSSYSSAPTLRFFPQPMDLSPPPPAQVDGGNGEQLAPEYVDPIAGLKHVSRTGRTLYVKPVEHLGEGIDLSRVENNDGLFEITPRSSASHQRSTAAAGRPRSVSRDGEKASVHKEVKGVRLHVEPGVTFWRFNIEVELTSRQERVAYRINQGPAIGFWVPARGQTMNIMFHSCNGFSLSVNSNDFSGPDPLWRDVLNTHTHRPFHVMLGGGDQIYNDAVMKHTTLFQEWLMIKNPVHKHSAEFTPEMQQELDTFYLDRYAMWFSQGLFGMANSQIPMVNIWDDHDIIDGFGSYPHHFMSTPVFAGLGAIAFKYYMLFQHQSVISETEADEPSWLLGASPGPYINELSRSVFMFLGRNVAFLGLDCRTERMRDLVLSDESYDRAFDRCRREIIKGETKHLIVLLGIPVAYPRLVWLETILTSKLMDPVKALGRTGLLGGFLNQFDGGVEILDDLDDHWTAKNHKGERNWFIQELQELAAEKSVRVTILGGDVHLAAVGQFYSNPKLKIQKDRDHRYMPNVISSAIVNTPPPEMMGDILNKRNKIHHLDHETDEDMIPMFTHDVDGKSRNNRRLLPRRNWCSIKEYHPGTKITFNRPHIMSAVIFADFEAEKLTVDREIGTTPPPTPPSPESYSSEEPQQVPPTLMRRLSLSKKDIAPGNLFRRNSRRDQPANSYVHGPMASSTDAVRPPSSSADNYFPPHNHVAYAANGNGGAPIRPSPFHRQPTGLSEKAATKGGGLNESANHIDLEGGLDIVINCEVSQKDPAGITTPYRLLVPALWYQGEGDPNPLNKKKGTWLKWRRGNKKHHAVTEGGPEYSQQPMVDEWGRDGDGRRMI
ncbi:MAG: hypothetical protein M1827_004332 [Pycnora praestabilis]|nr:MAG: hypothetical protein M1827_004332 [Pycnora praestabilis]